MKYDSLLWKLPLGVLLGVMAYFAYQFGQNAGTWAERQVQREGDRTRAELQKSIAATRKDVLGEVAALRKDTMLRVDALTTLTDDRLTDVIATVDNQLTRTNDTVAALRNDIQPSLTHVEAITQHADEASAILFRRDALPAQMLGLTAAAKVTLGEAAQTMRTVRDTTAAEGPATAKAIREATQQVSGIAADIHTFTTDAVAPVPWYKKVGRLLYSGAILGANFF